MDDLISRQAAIDALKERYYKYGRFAKIEELVWSIEKLPSAQSEPKWTPCSDRLPDTNRDVLLQFSTSMGVGFLEHNSWGG